MPRQSWAAPLAGELEDVLHQPVVVENDDSLSLDLPVDGAKENLQVMVRRVDHRVVCQGHAFRVPVFAPQGAVASLCRLSNASGGEFVVYPTSDCQFHAGVRVWGKGHDVSTVKSCLRRLLERIAYWREEARKIPLH